jgi:hypothetical protein
VQPDLVAQLLDDSRVLLRQIGLLRGVKIQVVKQRWLVRYGLWLTMSVDMMRTPSIGHFSNQLVAQRGPQL